MLDAGNQRSYITKQANKALKLKSEDKQQISIITFEAQCGKELTCEVVQIRMKKRVDQNQELQLFVVLWICKPLTAQPINIFTEEFEHIICFTLT